MTKKASVSAQELRQAAEEKRALGGPASPERSTHDESTRLLHELQVHQIELEMQNEELRRSLAEIEALRNRYFDLYELAPYALLTLNARGIILEANLTATTLLGIVRSKLLHQPLSRFVLTEDRDSYRHDLLQIFQSGESSTCELRMVRSCGTQFWALLEARIVKDAAEAPECRVVLNDISEHKTSEYYKNSGLAILRILNEPGDLQDSLQRIIAIFKMQADFAAVGIRLKKGSNVRLGFCTTLLFL